jgi:hypothetical protein
MRNLDSCRCWRCTLCPSKVRNKFLVNFWNRTILLCIPSIVNILFTYFISSFHSQHSFHLFLFCVPFRYACNISQHVVLSTEPFRRLSTAIYRRSFPFLLKHSLVFALCYEISRPLSLSVSLNVSYLPVRCSLLPYFAIHNPTSRQSADL